MTEPSSQELFVAGNLRLFVGPASDPGLPTSITEVEALEGADGWSEIGFTDENGAKFVDSGGTDPVPTAQSLYPARRIRQARDSTVTFMMREWREATVEFAYGGGEVTATDDGGWLYTPPDPQELNERSLVVWGIDDVKNLAIVIPKGMVTGDVESDFARTGASNLPVVFSATPDGSVAPWTIIGDWASFSDVVLGSS